MNPASKIEMSLSVYCCCYLFLLRGKNATENKTTSTDPVAGPGGTGVDGRLLSVVRKDFACAAGSTRPVEHSPRVVGAGKTNLIKTKGGGVV